MPVTTPSRSRRRAGRALALAAVAVVFAACAGGPRPTAFFLVPPQATPPGSPAAPATPPGSPAGPASAAPSASAGATESPPPTAAPTAAPTAPPTPAPTPTAAPTATPAPTPEPTASPAPTPSPTPEPTATPSAAPTTTPLPGWSAFVPGTSGSPRTIAITVGDDATFAPNTVTVAEGETIAFHVTNAGTKEHGFAVGPADDVFSATPKTTATATIQGGGSADVPYTFTGAGPFAFASHSDGDAAAGQVGYVIVVGPDVPAAGTETAPRLVHVRLLDGGFDPIMVPVSVGETVTFLVDNAGTTPREFVVGPHDTVKANAIDQVTTVTTGPIPVGQVRPLTYTFDTSRPWSMAAHATGQPAPGVMGAIGTH